MMQQREPTEFKPASELATIDHEELEDAGDPVDLRKVRERTMGVEDENIFQYMRHVHRTERMGTGVHVEDGEFVDDPAVCFDPQWPGRCTVCGTPRKACACWYDENRAGPWRHRQLGSQVPAVRMGQEVERAAAQYRLAFPELVD